MSSFKDGKFSFNEPEKLDCSLREAFEKLKKKEEYHPQTPEKNSKYLLPEPKEIKDIFDPVVISKALKIYSKILQETAQHYRQSDYDGKEYTSNYFEKESAKFEGHSFRIRRIRCKSDEKFPLSNIQDLYKIYLARFARHANLSIDQAFEGKKEFLGDTETTKLVDHKREKRASLPSMLNLSDGHGYVDREEMSFEKATEGLQGIPSLKSLMCAYELAAVEAETEHGFRKSQPHWQKVILLSEHLRGVGDIEKQKRFIYDFFVADYAGTQKDRYEGEGFDSVVAYAIALEQEEPSFPIWTSSSSGGSKILKAGSVHKKVKKYQDYLNPHSFTLNLGGEDKGLLE